MLRFWSYNLRFFWFYVCAFVENTFAFRVSFLPFHNMAIATDVIRSVICVCRSHGYTGQKRLKRSRCRCGQTHVRALDVRQHRYDRTDVRQFKSQLHHSEWQVCGTPARRWHCDCLQPCSSARRRHRIWSESGWSLYLRGLLLPTLSSPTNAAVVGLRLVGYTRLRKCEFIDWLLQHCSRWCTKDSYGQVAVCVERCCALCHRHSDRGLGQLLHDEFHWLDVHDRVFFKLAVIFQRCLNGCAPPYLLEYCVPVAGTDTRRHLR